MPPDLEVHELRAQLMSWGTISRVVEAVFWVRRMVGFARRRTAQQAGRKSDARSFGLQAGHTCAVGKCGQPGAAAIKVQRITHLWGWRQAGREATPTRC